MTRARTTKPSRCRARRSPTPRPPSDHPPADRQPAQLAGVPARRARQAADAVKLPAAPPRAPSRSAQCRLTATESRMTQFLSLTRGRNRSLRARLRAAATRGGGAVGVALALLRKGRTVDEAADLSRVVQASLGPRTRRSSRAARLRARLANCRSAAPSDASRRRRSRSASRPRRSSRAGAALAAAAHPRRAAQPEGLVAKVARSSRGLGADRIVQHTHSTSRPRASNTHAAGALLGAGHRSQRASRFADLGPARP